MQRGSTAVQSPELRRHAAPAQPRQPKTDIDVRCQRLVGDSRRVSTPLVQELPALVGVVVGAVAAYVTTWRRERDERWDAARMEAYAEFGNAVKHVFNLATRIAAGRGISYEVEPLNPDAEAASALSEAENERARVWESVLLLGNPATVEAARVWWHEVWRFVWFARGWLTDKDQWQIALDESNAARKNYYDCARRDLGVKGQADTLGPSKPQWLRNAEITLRSDDDT